MANEVSICNQALSWLGANQITALNEPSAEAIICNANYEELRDAVLEEHRWTFANATYKFGKALIVPNDDDNWRYANTFNIPSSILHVMRVFSDPNSPYQTKWERKGDKLFADDDVLYLDTTIRVVSPSAFSTLFRQALASRIARDICLGLTRNTTLHDAMSTKYENALIDAAASDGMQGINETIPPGTLVTSRNSVGGSYFNG
jgi:hypothetical protein